MSDIYIPHPDKRRALVIVDMQAGFLVPHTQWIIPNVKKVIEKGGYELIAESVFHAEKGSLWDVQTDWTFELQPTVPEIRESLGGVPSVLVTKETKSAFQGGVDLLAVLKEKRIQEVHIVGIDINDCVMATAFDSFDAGFQTYVIEECVDSSGGSDLREAALNILRNVDLTNHSKSLCCATISA